VTESQTGKAAKPRRLQAIIRWGFPMVTLAVTVAIQFYLPRLLQLGLGDGEYIAYIAVSSVGGYLGLADGGMLVSVLREMAAAHGAGDQKMFIAESRRAARIFLCTALIGLAMAGFGLNSAWQAAASSWAGASAETFKTAAAAFLVSICLTIGFGSFHTSMCFSTGRMLIGQIANLSTQALPAICMIAALAIRRSLPVALFSYAAVMATAATLRGLHGALIYRQEARDIFASAPRHPLRRVLGAGLALKFADVLPNAAFPHLLTTLAAGFVPAAIPARTFANSTRMANQLLINLLSPHITRRLAGNDEERQQGSSEYRMAARLLCSIHLGLVGIAALTIVPVFRLWLPIRAAEVSFYIEGMLAEQALLAAVLPASVLFAAGDRLRLLGIVRSIGVVLGLAAFVLSLPWLGPAAFGFGLGVSALPYFIAGWYAEAKPLDGFPAQPQGSSQRYGLALLAALCTLGYRHQPLLVGLIIVGLSLVLLPQALRELYMLYRGTSFDSGR
jgi:hypothetical protein